MENHYVFGEMTLWGNRERYGQGQQRTEKVGGLAEGYFLQRKDTAKIRIE